MNDRIAKIIPISMHDSMDLSPLNIFPPKTGYFFNPTWQQVHSSWYCNVFKESNTYLEWIKYMESSFSASSFQLDYGGWILKTHRKIYSWQVLHKILSLSPVMSEVFSHVSQHHKPHKNLFAQEIINTVAFCAVKSYQLVCCLGIAFTRLSSILPKLTKCTF